ncbi:MAG: DUF5110 domain-containing protein [Cyclobacteriaceae bacterium]|nr:DUF5110 domain-containing protein [Cyclobacteriaceae bacterium]MCH8517507.1 DUF5110 domain-containing protein [Cyclobacteriaceae bacterium]
MKYLFKIVGLSILIGFMGCAEPQVKNELGQYVEHQLKEGRLSIQDNYGNSLVISPYSESVARIDVLIRDQAFVPDSSDVIIDHSLSSDEWSVEEEDSYLIFRSSTVTIHIDKASLELSFLRDDQAITSFHANRIDPDNGSALGFSLSEGEEIYGLGFHAVAGNRRGDTYDIYHRAQYGYANNEKSLNVTMPFYVSSLNYGLYIDNSMPSVFDIGDADTSKIQYRNEGGNITIYWIGDSQPTEILRSYHRLSGYQPLPPMWSLGYIQSKYGYKTADEAEAVIDRLLAYGNPISGLVLDLYWFGEEKDMGNLDWAQDQFPDPAGMINNFKAKNVETVIITEPYFTQESVNYSEINEKGFFTTNSEGDTWVIEDFWAGSASLIDMQNPEALEWMWPFYAKQIDIGISGWWSDLGEPEEHPDEMRHKTMSAREAHNTFSLKWAEMLHRKYEENYPEKRLFNLIRSGFAGMQRYSTFPWSGDIQRSFDGLSSQVPIMLGMSMSGVAYMHSDLGGFTDGDKDDELYARWLQFGAFTPIMRPHGNDTPEPWNYTVQTQDIVKEYAMLRHKMMPYNYTLAFESTLKGLPLARPMFFDKTAADQTAYFDTQYFWGDAFIVAPIVEAGSQSIEVYLPEGEWYNYHTLEKLDGGSAMAIQASVDQLPLLVKSGSFVPMVTDYQAFTSSFTTDTLVVDYYLGDGVNSKKTFYWDDGINALSLKNNQYETLTFEAKGAKDEITLAISRDTKAGYTGMPEERFFELKIKGYGNSRPKEVWIGANKIDNSQLVLNSGVLSIGLLMDENEASIKIVR